MNIVEFIWDSQQQLSCRTLTLLCDDGKCLEVMTAVFYFMVLCSLHHLMHMDPHISISFENVCICELVGSVMSINHLSLFCTLPCF